VSRKQKITRGKATVGRYTLSDRAPYTYTMSSRSVRFPNSTTITSPSGTNRSVSVLETASVYCELRTQQPVVPALLASQ